MTQHAAEPPAQKWMEIGKATLLGTAAALSLSFILTYLLLFSDALTPFGRSMVIAVAIPLLVAAPLSFLAAYHRQETRHYRRALTRSATYDRSTEVLNGTVFSSLVDRRVSSGSNEGAQQGAFLVVNVGTLRSINMRYGLDWGEEALRLVAATIRSSVRNDDIVGRLGASEFGVFLSGANEENAREVGNRIRAEVARVYFAPDRPAHLGAAEMLSVSVGGVIFEHQLEFEALYGAAGKQLLNAESSGAVEIFHIAREFTILQDLQVRH